MDVVSTSQAVVAAGHTVAVSESARAAVVEALGAGVQAGLFVTGIVFLITALAALTLVRNRPH